MFSFSRERVLRDRKRGSLLPDRNRPYDVALIYFALGCLWILVTDELVVLNTLGSPALQESYQTLKGILFVALSSVVIFVLVRMLYSHLVRQNFELGVLFSVQDLGVMTFDDGGRIKSLTAGICRFLGYEDERLLSERLDDITHPEDRRKEVELLGELRSGERQSASYQKRLRKRDGSYIWVEQNVALLEKSGERADFITTVQNINERVETQSELIRKTDRLKWAQEVARMGDWIFDPETEEVRWSEEINRIFERAPGSGPAAYRQLLETSFFPEDARRLDELVRTSLEHEVPYDFQHRFKLPDGRVKHLRSIGLPFRDPGDNKLKLRGIIQDMTEMKELKSDLEARREQMDVLVNNLPGVIFQFQRLPNGDEAIIYTSEGTEAIWGLPKEFILKDMRLVWEQIHPEDLDALLDSIDASARGLTPWRHAWRSRHPTGGEHWHEGMGKPHREEDGTIIWNSLILDVTERIEAEARLREQEGYLQLMGLYASDALVACNAKGELLFFNETMRSWIGSEDPTLGPNEWAGHYGIYTLDRSRHLREEELPLVRSLRGETVRNFAFLMHKDGREPRYVEANGGPLNDDEGNLVGAMVIIRDITDRYRKEFEISTAAVDASERERAQIASELHDSVVQELSMVSLNLNNHRLEQGKAGDSQRLEEALIHLTEAIQQVRGISHRIIPKSVRDFGLVGAVNELAEDIGSATSLKVTFICNAEVRLNESLELDVFRVIQEALSNIIKHAGAGLVTINMTFSEHFLSVSINDDGKGMAGEEVEFRGKGIGMKTMKFRAQRWGGNLFVESDASGTTVYLDIPLKEMDEKDPHIYR